MCVTPAPAVVGTTSHTPVNAAACPIVSRIALLAVYTGLILLINRVSVKIIAKIRRPTICCKAALSVVSMDYIIARLILCQSAKSCAACLTVSDC